MQELRTAVVRSGELLRCSDSGSLFVFSINSVLQFPPTVQRHTGVVAEDFVFQPCLSVSTRHGDSVTLECYTNAQTLKTWIWVKYMIGQAPRTIITTFYENVNFYEEFKNTSRVTVKKDDRSFNVTFLQVELSDSATYFCGLELYNSYYFGNGTILMVKGTEAISISVVQQPVVGSVQTGDDVTLKCIIHTEIYAEKHNVYWFRHGSGKSLPGIIYVDGNRSDQCERNSEAGLPTQSCVYNLPKKNISPSDVGTYYCALVTCGQILYGNGSLLDIAVVSRFDRTVLALGATNAVCVIVIIVLICTRNKHCAVNLQICHGCVNTDPTRNQDTDMLNYAPLNFTHNKTSSGWKSREIDTQVVYADVRSQQCG
ncbi:uncharacterized protein [Lepisosteus oculatus]|uniref:uncharacterized protein isoform X1 n=1 Tax=Lepisosteus oculatus TaxID=7918 RepID=UPI0035F51E9B